MLHPGIRSSIEPVYAFAHQSTHTLLYQSLAGTMGYIPPEAMLREGSEEVSSAEFKKGDVYSFGVLMCYILSGIDPFATLSEVQIVAMIGFKNKRPAIPSHVDKDPLNPVFKEMIQVLWHRDPHRRSDFATIVEQLSVYAVNPGPKKSMGHDNFFRALPPLLTGTRCMLGGMMPTTSDAEFFI